MKIEFRCDKDPVLAKFYEDRFRERFESELTPQILRHIQDGHPGVFTGRMLAEAKRQEHYDFTVAEDGHREVIRDDNGEPVLLIPLLVISELDK